ncbi:MAG: NAD(P)/FAD-dependent oxidoreductase [Pseudoflavonifractor sp.]
MGAVNLNVDIIVIGGGAAGCLAAITAARRGASVLLLERNPKLGRKLYITGKGRCNLTNDCTATEMLKNVPCNSRFLFSAVTRFPAAAVQEFFEAEGVPLKTERGNRVFPQSDHATDIIDALLMGLRHAGVEIMQERAEEIVTRDCAVAGVKTERGTHHCKAVILATGGVSYPLTGSTGDGYRMAEELGHSIVAPAPSLVALVTEGDICQQMQGLSLRNVAIKVKNSKGKTVYAEQGELLFTHFGLSGPLILSASAHMREWNREHYTVLIDLKPALDEKTLDARLLRDFAENLNRDFHNVLDGLVPKLMVPVLVELSGIPADTKVNVITKEQRRRFLELLKCVPVEVKGPRSVEEAIVTSGGVKVTEVDPKTMGSKLVDGLYFAGEVLDVDAYTGGFNLQIAWSTGHAAGEGAAEQVMMKSES